MTVTITKEKSNKVNKISRTKKPADMTLEQWQRALRIEYGQAQEFTLVNRGIHPVYSTFSVHNPESKKTYRVAIRGDKVGVNFCSCPDYAVNTLGVCKHIAFTLDRLKKKPANISLFNQPYQPDFSEVYIQYGSQRKVIVSIGSGAPSHRGNNYRMYINKDGSLKPNGFRCFNAFLTRLRKGGHEVRCYEDSLELIAQINDAEKRKKLIDTKFAKNTTQKISGIKAALYPYQFEGVLFAAKAGRCIIADEMGLGKTIQAIAAAELMARYYGIEHVLIVSPTSVKYQWKSEIEKFCSRSSQIIEGLSHIREKQYQHDVFYSIASYEQIYRDIKNINKADFDLIILDETQRIKNWKTRTAKTIKELNSTYALALTGTPLENRIEELHSIVSFIDRHRLGPLFKFLYNHEVHDEKGKVIGYKNLGDIGKSLDPILIRRKKDIVQKQLPPRMEKHHFVPMTDLQTEYHTENAEIARRIASKWARYHYLSEADQRRLMIALLRMRMACDDAYLVDKENRAGHKIEVLKDVLSDFLETPETKVVIFSQWTTMQELVAEMLDHMEIGYVYLHGGVPAKKRKGLMEDFQLKSEIRVFLSTDAGQTGLNLQTASVIINLDLPWNPAILEQRIGRIHRIGQKRSVQVINFVATGTIEHGMLDVLKFKKSVFSGVLDGGSDMVMMGGSRLSKFMKDVAEVTGKIPDAKTMEEPSEIAQQAQEDVQAEHKTPPDSGQTITALLEAGSRFLSSLMKEVSSGNSAGAKNGPPSSKFITRDPDSGKQSLNIPLPPEDTMRQIASIAVPFLSQFLGNPVAED